MNVLTIYFQPRMLVIFALGIASGLPLALTASTLSIWLAEVGVSKAAIGLFAAISTPYAIKFLWAPLVDQLPIPMLSRVIGQRRAWLLLVHVSLIISLLMLGGSNPLESPWYTALFALMVAISSATQDIIIDAYRVEYLPENEQGAGAAAIVFGYRIGMLISGAGALAISTYFGWFITYLVMAAIVPLAFIIVLFAGEPKRHKQVDISGWGQWLKVAVVAPFTEFMNRTGWMMILVFIILYKLGDAFAGFMTGPFLVDIGFSKIEIATIVKTYGLAATLAGAYIGGSLVVKVGIWRSLLICGILQMFSNLLFVIQAQMGHNELMLTLTISVENLSGGMGTAAFVAYISALCNRQFTATQYALFSALAVSGRTWLSTPSGYIVEYAGWEQFFIFSTVIALPGVLLLVYLRKRGLF